MKTMFKTAIAVIALAAPAAAFAQSHTTSSTTYSAQPTPEIWHYKYIFFGPKIVDVPGQTSEQRYNDGVGSRFQQSSSAPNDVGTAGAQAADNQQTFTLTGKVNQDCSFYDGGSSTHSIALNTIGIRTQNSDNVSQAFNQAAAITANFNTATAGCNTRNTVTIKSDKGGKLLNTDANATYDSTQFTAEIPYSLNATWTGVDVGGGTNTQAQAIKWDAGQYSAAKTKTGGAWRSAFNMDIVAPAQSKGLVAGDYTDTITVTLAAS